MMQVIVAGGGAAGMMAAIAAAQQGCGVSLYEKNEKLGKKLYITGKGRCNVTNACETQELFSHLVTNSKFMYSSIYGFTNFDMMDFLEARGCRLKTERGQRVFPVSDKSSDVIRALTSRLEELSVEVHLNTPVAGLIVEDNVCRGVRLGNSRADRRLADRVIVATGGLSYPSTGSTGDGYQWAREAGHGIAPCYPGLTPFETAPEDHADQLQGLSLRNVEVSVYRDSKKLYGAFGEMLFTHYGVSGPTVLSASSAVAGELRRRPLTLSVDLKPALSREQLDARILRDFEESKNRSFKNALGRLYPAKLAPEMVFRSGVDPDKKVNAITREERAALVNVTKDFRLTLVGLRGFNEAIITQGGIKVREVDPSTMGSRLARGLYFAGEVLDVDGVTGGFNLQVAWSTGWAAGLGAAGAKGL